MHRFYIPPGQLNIEAPELAGREAHHCARVRRVKRGEQIVVFDGQGTEWLAEVAATEKNRVKLRIIEGRSVAPPNYNIILAQSLLPHGTMDWIVQKATELGARRVIPIVTQRSVAQIKTGEVAKKMERWIELTIEAAKQCGDAWLPVIEPPRVFTKFLQRDMKNDLKLIAALHADARYPKDVLREFAEGKGRAPTSVVVAIGPEGDFTPEELEAARTAGFVPISLGGLILRSETAAIYALSVLSYEFQCTRIDT